MKRMVKGDIVDLEVIINIECQTSNVAAGTYVNHPDNVSKKHKLSEAKLTVLDDIVQTVIANITAYNFKLGDHYQSKKSYAYYVEFTSTDPHCKISKFRIKFRIAEHGNNEVAEARSHVIIKSIVIGKEEFKNPFDMVEEINDMFEQLAEGDMTALNKFLV